MVFHVLNRGVGRRRLFTKPTDYEAFEEIIAETLEKRPPRIRACCLMPNHWQFVPWLERNDDLATFMQRLTVTHVTRRRKHRGGVGGGHVHQGRFKSFPVETDDHFYQFLRYVERNALRAGLCRQAEEWRWGSVWRRIHGTLEQRRLLSGWPLPQPRQWIEHVNRPQGEAELDAIRRCVARGQPQGSAPCTEQSAREPRLESTLRSRGRPRNPDSEPGHGYLETR
jgi:putative transposase